MDDLILLPANHVRVARLDAVELYGEAIRNALRGYMRTDAGEVAVMARELESIETYVIPQRYPTLKALDFVPLIGGIDKGAATYTWRKSDYGGSFELVDGQSTELPNVDINLGEFYRPIRSWGGQYGYTVQQLREFALARSRGSSIALDTMRALAAREVAARKADSVIALGEPSIAAITGCLNDANVPIIAATGAWSGLTPLLILADLFRIVRTARTQSKDIFAADTLVLPIDKYELIKQTPVGTDVNKTIYSFFRDNATDITAVEPWYRLTNAGAGGAIDRAWCFKRDVLVLGAIHPIVFEAQPPQQRDFLFSIPCEMRCGGTVVRQPLAAVYMDGI